MMLQLLPSQCNGGDRQLPLSRSSYSTAQTSLAATPATAFSPSRLVPALGLVTMAPLGEQMGVAVAEGVPCMGITPRPEAARTGLGPGIKYRLPAAMLTPASSTPARAHLVDG